MPIEKAELRAAGRGATRKMWPRRSRRGPPGRPAGGTRAPAAAAGRSPGRGAESPGWDRSPGPSARPGRPGSVVTTAARPRSARRSSDPARAGSVAGGPGPVGARRSGWHGQADERPDDTAHDDPHPAVPGRPMSTAQATPAAAATTSRRPFDRPTARPAIAAGKTTSRPRTRGSGMNWPPTTPRIVATFQGMKVEPIAAIQ